MPSVRSNVRQSEKVKASTKTAHSSRARHNLVLVGVVAGAFVLYIVSSIFFASSQYALTMKKSDYRKINTAYATAETSVHGSNTMNDLVSFSQRAGMIDASKESPVVMYAKESGVALLQD